MIVAASSNLASGKVIVGLSGGVDSAVTAALLLEKGYQVEALFMRNWSEDDAYCASAEDQDSAQAVADRLGIDLHFADFSADYRQRVFEDFLNEYRAGRTPSPDLLCNREIKFGVFLDHARALGADWIATGHYARLEHSSNKTKLLCAADKNKDQTYFLSATPGTAFRQVLFPLGELTKPEVRRIATRLGLPNHQRKDSTGVCFIGERPIREFLQNWIAVHPGDIRTDDGRVIGRHDGIAYYTLGQRTGLGIGGVQGAKEAPWYVAERQSNENCLIVTQDKNDTRLNSRFLRLGQCYWVNDAPRNHYSYGFRIRHRQPLMKATIIENSPYMLRSDEAVWAAAPGQFAVLYDGNECVGCGVIEQALYD